MLTPDPQTPAPLKPTGHFTKVDTRPDGTHARRASWASLTSGIFAVVCVLLVLADRGATAPMPDQTSGWLIVLGAASGGVSVMLARGTDPSRPTITSLEA